MSNQKPLIMPTKLNKGIQFQVKEDVITIDYPNGISVKEATDFTAELAKYYDLSQFEIIWRGYEES